jgi:hypothetical protein
MKAQGTRHLAGCQVPLAAAFFAGRCAMLSYVYFATNDLDRAMIRHPTMQALCAVIFAVVSWAGTASPNVARTDSPLFVGVLENVEPGNSSQVMSVAHVRIAFQKLGVEWIPLRTDFKTEQTLAESFKYYPAAVDWTVVFNGKKIGAITSKNPGPIHGYGDLGTQPVTTAAKLIPQIYAGASDFSHLDNPAKTRPLLVVSAPNFKDPDKWKPTSLSIVEKQLAVREFRHRFPSLELCDKPEQEPIHMVPYSDTEVLLVKAYRSIGGEVLYGLRLDDKRSNCGFVDDRYFFDYWFVLDQHQHIRLLGSQMIPVDAADLDNRGRSEWIFYAPRGDNEDGYELFYDDFAKKASFHWTYH